MTSEADLIHVSAHGLHCARGGFVVDPWRPVDLAVVTHAHSDHARPGSTRYLAAAPGVPLLRRRLGRDAIIEPLEFGERRRLGEVTVSLHPAGHVLGSAQVLVESDAERWVVTGDFKRQADPSCEPFEVVACDTLITEATFALPIYRWPDPGVVARSIVEWWDGNAEDGRASVILVYALGKAQRILAELARLVDRPVALHGALVGLTDSYREAGVVMPPTSRVSDRDRGDRFAGELILAPPSAAGSTWMRRFGACSIAFASGWMQVRGVRRRRGVDRGFVLSDHADWDDLLRTIEETGARRVLTTHGYGDALVRVLRARGLEAATLETAFRGETDDDGPPADDGGEVDA